MGGISIRGRSRGFEREEVSRKQSGVCVFVECRGGVVEGEELGPNSMPRGCPYIGVVPSTLTLRDSCSRVTRLMAHGES